MSHSHHVLRNPAHLLDPASIGHARVFSQGGQDGIIHSIFEAIGTTNKCCVEFGFNSDTLTGGTGANTARLILEDGWNGILFDSEFANPAINLHREFITPENIADIFQKYNVPYDVDYVSIDVDSVDLWLFLGLLNSGYRPRLISVEYNCHFRIQESVTVKPGTPGDQQDAVYGASLTAFHRAAREHNYHLVAVEPTLDLFFVRGDLVDPRRVPPLDAFVGSTGLIIHKVPTPEREKSFVTYPALEPVTTFPWHEPMHSFSFVIHGPLTNAAWNRSQQSSN